MFRFEGAFQAGFNAGADVPVDGGQGAEEQAADVGESSGAAEGDGVTSERVVDALGLEAKRFAHQEIGEVRVFLAGLLFGHVVRAQAGRSSGEGTALAAAGAKAMRAAECSGVNGGWLSHGRVAPRIGVCRREVLF